MSSTDSTRDRDDRECAVTLTPQQAWHVAEAVGWQTSKAVADVRLGDHTGSWKDQLAAIRRLLDAAETFMDDLHWGRPPDPVTVGLEASRWEAIADELFGLAAGGTDEPWPEKAAAGNAIFEQHEATR